MNCFLRYLLLFCLLAGTNNTLLSQNQTIELSKNKVVVNGETYLLHIVKPKQTLFSISKAYGVNLAELMRVNHKTEATVSIDEVLRIPFTQKKGAIAPILVRKEDAKYFYHVVKQKETLYSLSKQYNVSIDAIQKENPGTEKGLATNTVVKIPKTVEKPQQQVSTVPKPDKKYYYYEIKPGDTQYSIAKQFMMKQKKLRKLNPKLKNKVLKPGDWVRIPRYLVAPELLVEKEIKKDTAKQEIALDTIQKEEIVEVDSKKNLRIGLFLPLYLEANDTINQMVTYHDTIEVITEREPRILYRKSREFLRFYQGILMAVDSLQKQGLTVDLHVFDTERNSMRMSRIMSEIQFEDFDFWIGPVYPNTFSIAAEFAKNKGVPIISPLSARNREISNNSNVIQLNTSLNSICKQLSDYICTDFEYKNIVVVHPERYKHFNEYQVVKDVEKQLFEEGLYWKNDIISYKKISFDEDGLYGIEAALCDTCENIVVLPINDQPMIENIVTNLNVLSKQFAIRLIGFSKWQRFNSLNPELYYNLNLSLISPYHIDYNSEDIKTFEQAFRERFNCEPTDFSYRGYDLCRFFSIAASRYGKYFPEKMNDLHLHLLQSSYHFKQKSDFGGWENIGTHIINFSRDYKIRSRKTKIQEEPKELDLIQKSFEY